MWIATFQDGVYRLADRVVTQFGTADGLRSANVFAVAVAPDDSVWAGTENGLSRYDGTSWHPVEGGRGTTAVEALAIGADGVVWVGTGRGGARFDGQEWQLLSVETGLPSNVVTAIVVNDDAVWFGTSAGAALLRQGRWSYVSVLDGLPDSLVHDIAVAPADATTVWFATEAGTAALAVEYRTEFRLYVPIASH
jgi:ligand-binding sensor domain-containing protein